MCVSLNRLQEIWNKAAELSEQITQLLQLLEVKAVLNLCQVIKEVAKPRLVTSNKTRCLLVIQIALTGNHLGFLLIQQQ